MNEKMLINWANYYPMERNEFVYPNILEKIRHKLGKKLGFNRLFKFSVNVLYFERNTPVQLSAESKKFVDKRMKELIEYVGIKKDTDISIEQIPEDVRKKLDDNYRELLIKNGELIPEIIYKEGE